MEVSCSKCSEKVEVKDRFCKNCGEAMLLAGGVLPPVDEDAAGLVEYARKLAEYSRNLRECEPLNGRAQRAKVTEVHVRAEPSPSVTTITTRTPFVSTSTIKQLAKAVSATPTPTPRLLDPSVVTRLKRVNPTRIVSPGRSGPATVTTVNYP